MRRTIKIFLGLLIVIVGLPIILIVVLSLVGLYLYFTADFMQPNVDIDMNRYALTIDTDSLKLNAHGLLRQNEYGLWEAKIAGSAVERGASYGILGRELLKYQEDVFVERIHEMIPSEWWVEFLHKLILIFNGGMAQHIPQELREEIYAVSCSCTDEYNAYGSPYVRQLNYHAAHDIGHAMQQYMLVGCSSFASWDSESEDGGLVVGRNFDFYMGDSFAKNKVVLFVEPNEGYRFVSVTWPGMMGVVSGMNEKGLSVTINAASGAMPTVSAMPISLLTREILQYATTIDEAYQIAEQRQTFVSESILVASAIDGYAAIIEKTPENIALYKSQSNHIVCTNHYQSECFEHDEYNQENIATSDSPYRYQRIEELIAELSPLSPSDAVSILRNRHGIEGEDIGLSNEKSVNQFIAHHSVVFQPEKLRMMISTSPWQLGEFVCYDLNRVFSLKPNEATMFASPELNIEADSSAIADECQRVVRYREQYVDFRDAIDARRTISHEDIDSFINNNPNYFQVYNTVGDYMHTVGRIDDAVLYWQKALTLEIPRLDEKEQIINKVQLYGER